MSLLMSIVDVFAGAAFGGNPVAVVHDADQLSTEEMQRLAQWMNLSETTFLLAPSDPDADYRVRIFTPSTELPFAGHPTLGSAHAWLGEGGEPSAQLIRQECGVGVVELRREHEGGLLAFKAPPLIRSGPVAPDLLERIVELLRVDPGSVVDAAWVDNGPGWIGLLLDSAETVLALRPGDLAGLDVGVIGPLPADYSEQWEVRAWFRAGDATVEDPVTGSLNASLATWLISTGRATAPYVARQGTAMGRTGRVHVNAEPATNTIWIGGSTTTRMSGRVDVDGA